MPLLEREHFVLAAFGGKDEWLGAAAFLGLDRVVARRIALSLCSQEAPPDTEQDRRAREQTALHFHGNRTLGQTLKVAIARRDGLLHSVIDEPVRDTPPTGPPDDGEGLTTPVLSPHMALAARQRTRKLALLDILADFTIRRRRALAGLAATGTAYGRSLAGRTGVGLARTGKAFTTISLRLAKRLMRETKAGLSVFGRRCRDVFEQTPAWVRALWHDEIGPSSPSDAKTLFDLPQRFFSALRAKWREVSHAVRRIVAKAPPSSPVDGGFGSEQTVIERWNGMGEATKNMIVASALRGYPPALSFVQKLALHVEGESGLANPPEPRDATKAAKRRQRIERAVARGNSRLFKLYWTIFPPIG